MTGWHNNPDLKHAAVQRMVAHREHDAFIQGTFLEPDNGGYRGCFHGCLTADALLAENNITIRQLEGREPNWHREGERLWGIPHRLGEVLDFMFEALPAEDCAAFAVAVTEAIPVGADLSQVVDRWLLDILADPEAGVWRHTRESSAQRAAVEAVSALHRRRLAGDEPTHDEWIDARRAAYAAAAAASAASDAAASASDAAASAAASDAAAYASDAAYASAAAAGRWQADQLIHHITTAPGSARRPARSN